MSWLFPKKKEYKDYYDEAYLLAVFAPKTNLDKLKQQYASMRKNSNNNHIMKAKMAGFMAGLEARNKSRIHLLDKAQQKSIDRDKDDFGR